MKKILSALLLAAIVTPFGLAASGGVFVLSMLLGGGSSLGLAFTGMIDASGLTLDRDGIQAASELIYTDKFVSPSWNTYCDVRTGVKNNSQLVYGGHFNGLAGSIRTACDVTANPYSITMSEKTFTPKYIKDIFEECYDRINSSTWWKKILPAGMGKEDLTKTEFQAYVVGRMSEYMGDDLMHRLIWMTNTAIASGTGVNSLTADELKYFNMFNGVFAQLAVIYTANSDRVTDLTQNDEAAWADQKFSATDTTNQVVTGYFNAALDGATAELKGRSDGIWIVSDTVLRQYVKERKAVANIEEAYKRTETGITGVMVDGRPVIALPVHDRLTERHFIGAGTKRTTPHFILLTTDKNIVVATEEESNFSEFKSFYDEKSETAVWKFGFNMDVKIIDDNLVQVVI